MAGKTFWGQTSGGWGPRTGTIATQTVKNTTVSQAAGYYSVFNLSTVELNLATGNIKSGATIFGVLGSTTVVDTASGTPAANGDILTGKTAYVNGSLVTGTVAAGSNVNGGQGLKTFTISDGMYSGSKTATAVDTNLAAGNIKTGMSIFGMTGTYTADGTATAGDMLLNKTAYVNGSKITGTGYPAAVPKTGQTTQYQAGDDGALKKGVVWPNPRFTDNSNGTVTDNLTGLIWLKDANAFGQCSWTTAVTNCNNLQSGQHGLTDGSGVGDWRLPNVKELQGLIDFNWFNPALCNTAGTGNWASNDPFTSVQSDSYWSSTTYAFNTDFAWGVYLYDGHVYYGYKPGTLYVWPVRAGQ